MHRVATFCLCLFVFLFITHSVLVLVVSSPALVFSLSFPWFLSHQLSCFSLFLLPVFSLSLSLSVTFLSLIHFPFPFSLFFSLFHLLVFHYCFTSTSVRAWVLCAIAHWVGLWRFFFGKRRSNRGGGLAAHTSAGRPSFVCSSGALFQKKSKPQAHLLASPRLLSQFAFSRFQ